MPTSAIGARVVDFVLPPEEIARELARLATESELRRLGHAPPAGGRATRPASLDEVFALLRGAFRVDFSAYKLPTIRRRIARRMLVRRVDDLARVRRPAGGRRRRGRGALPRHPDHGHRVLPRAGDVRRAARARHPGHPARQDGDGSACASGCPAVPAARRPTAWPSPCSTVMVAQRRRGAGQDLRHRHQRARPRRARAAASYAGERLRQRSRPTCCAATSRATEGGYQISKSVRELCVFARHDVTQRPSVPEPRPGELPQPAHLPRSRPAALGDPQSPLRTAARRLSRAGALGVDRPASRSSSRPSTRSRRSSGSSRRPPRQGSSGFRSAPRRSGRARSA